MTKAVVLTVIWFASNLNFLNIFKFMTYGDLIDSENPDTSLEEALINIRKYYNLSIADKPYTKTNLWKNIIVKSLIAFLLSL